MEDTETDRNRMVCVEDADDGYWGAAGVVCDGSFCCRNIYYGYYEGQLESSAFRGEIPQGKWTVEIKVEAVDFRPNDIYGSGGFGPNAFEEANQTYAGIVEKFELTIEDAKYTAGAAPCPIDSEPMLQLTAGQDLQHAIELAKEYNIPKIKLGAGVYRGSFDTLGRAITIEGSIDGNGYPTSILSTGSATNAILTCQNRETRYTIFKNLLIKDGINGGMYNGFYSDPTLENCVFKNNTLIGDWDGDKEGGGMYNYGGDPTLTGCTFENNTADDGGGMYNAGGSPTLTNCIFENNNADYGGGMYNSEYSGVNDPTMTNCTFVNNTATYAGGGMCNFFEAKTTLTDCTFMDNDANNGGGIFNYYGSTATLTNCVFENNAANYGGGIYNATSVAWISNSSFCGNVPIHIYGDWVDLDGNTFDVDCDDDPPLCMADVNSDYNVDVLDLLYVIAVWETDNPAGDINEDGWVDVGDLLEVISVWGACP